MKKCVVAILGVLCIAAVIYALFATSPKAREHNLHNTQQLVQTTLRFNQDVAGEVLRLTNEERTKAGVLPLEDMDALDTVAQSKVKEMHTQHYFAHASPHTGTLNEQFAKWGKLQLGEDITALGENIARSEGYSSVQLTARFWVACWVNSPEHYESMVNPAFTHMGAAIGIASDGTALAVQEFASK